MPNTDIRIQVTFPAHWKTRKLEYLLGEAGPKYLIYLWCYAGVSKPLGDFSGMTDEEIEASAFWPGESGKLIEGLIESGYLNGEKGERKLHDWKEHNGWAYGFPSRSERNRKNRVKPVKEKHKVVKEKYNVLKGNTVSHGDGNGKVMEGKGDGEVRKKPTGHPAVAKWTDLMREHLDSTYKPPGYDCKACKEVYEHLDSNIEEFERRAQNCINDEWFRDKKLNASYFAKNVERFKEGTGTGLTFKDEGVFAPGYKPY